MTAAPLFGSVLYNVKFFGPKSRVIRSIKDFKQTTPDVLVLWGGSDINPSIYGQKNVASQYIDDARDIVEMALIEECIAKDIPMIGVCRGAQLLCFMLGGSMYQHVSGHQHGHHGITLTKDIASEFGEGSTIGVTTCHHQMMIPAPTGRVLLEARVSTYREKAVDRNTDQDFKDCEAILYPENKVLCFQPHPEYYGKDNPCLDLYFKYLDLII